MMNVLILALAIQSAQPGEENPSQQPQSSPIAVQLYIFGESARGSDDQLDGVLATVERIGYDNVQGWLDTYDTPESASRFSALLAKHGLSMPAAYTGGAMHVQREAEEAIETILRRAKIAAAHRLQIAVINPDPLPREKTDEELEIQSKNLDRLGAELRKLGLRLAIHQHAPEMRSGAREWYHILHNTSPENVFFCLDLHWVYRGEQDPYKLLADAGKRTIDLHLRNSRNGAWAEEFGEGDIDYRRVRKVLDEIGYEGYYTIELAYEKETKITRSLEENLKRSLEYTQTVSNPDPVRADNHRTDWFHRAKWGVFTHYLSGTVLKDVTPTVEEWNQVVDSFDVEAYAETLSEASAGYSILTLGQNSGFYCSPNAAYDRHVGIVPSKCSKRDLVADMADALQPKGIRLMVYLPSGAPDRDTVAMKALEWKMGKYFRWEYPDGGPDGGDPRFDSFQSKWEEIIREWSDRWGDKVAGWWFDGCYFPKAMYEYPDPPNFESFAAAARSGNSNSIVAFNPGVTVPIIRLTRFEDYTAGETNEPEKVECHGRWVDGAQFHMLSYLGPAWAQGPPRFSTDEAIAITRKITDNGGVVTWDVPISGDGGIPEAFLKQLRALGNVYSRNKE